MIPILMNSEQTITALVSDKTAGIGALSETQKCEVTEERNGAYTLTLKIPVSAKHFHDIAVGGVIRAKANETSKDQLFRICKISKPISGIVTITANHISYDLGKTSVLPCSATGAVTAMETIQRNMQGGTGFVLSTDIVNGTSTFTNNIPQSCRACFGGSQGSMLDVFGGEYEWDNNRVILHAHRGTDRGVVLRYGKNITDFQQDENIESTYTAVMPYVVINDGETVLGTLQTMIESDEPRILNLDLSSKFNMQDSTPSVEEINSAAQTYINVNKLTTPKVSIKVSFLHLADTEEYKDIAPLEHVCLCDTVKVEYSKLGVSATAKVIKTVYDTLKEKYTEIEIGDAHSSLAKTITGITDETETAATGYMDQAIASFSSLISQGLGLFITKAPTADGSMKVFMHNKPTLAESQYQWTLNSNGLALSTDYGNTWKAGIDSDGNALFNVLSANTINALKVNGGSITYGTDKTATLTSTNSGVGWFGDGTMLTELSGDYTVGNLSKYNPGDYANWINLHNDEDVSRTSVVNFDSYSGEIANYLYMSHFPIVDNSGLSNIHLTNYNLDLPERTIANDFNMQVDYTNKACMMRLDNKDYVGTNGNRIQFTSDQTHKNRIDLASYEYGTNTAGSYLILNGNGIATLRGYESVQIDGPKVAITSDTLSSLSSDTKTQVSAPDVLVSGSTKATLQGNNVTVNATGTLTIAGGTVKIGGKTLYFHTTGGVTYLCGR